MVGVLEVSAQKLKALKRTLARGLGKTRPTQASRTLGTTIQNIEQKSRQIISKFTTEKLINRVR
jgi:hypothetical protein